MLAQLAGGDSAATPAAAPQHSQQVQFGACAAEAMSRPCIVTGYSEQWLLLHAMRNVCYE